MRKTLLILLLVACLFLAGCTPPPIPITGTVPPTSTRSLSPSATPPSTQTPVPPTLLPPASQTSSESETPAPSDTPEPTRTAFPFPLTSLPTFDKRRVQKIPTQLPVICPPEDPNVVLQDSSYDGLTHEKFLKYLNAGGSFKTLTKENSGVEKIIDLTGDGKPEIIFNYAEIIIIYGCTDGKFENLVVFTAPHAAFLEGVSDLNKNGIPEVLIRIGTTRNVVLSIYEWNGREFRSLIANQYDPYHLSNVYDWLRGDYQISDTNGDGLQEIIAVDEQTSLGYWEHFTPFNQIITLAWDGEHYINGTLGNYLYPKYRYQMIELGDREVLLKNYKKALAFYQGAIFDANLEPWSREKLSYDLDHLYQTPSPNDVAPITDPAEYDRLAAYAYYRSMILHIYLGQVDIAKKEHETLQAKFPSDNPGFSSAEMADQFWKIYRAGGKIADACQAAIQYATSDFETIGLLSRYDANGLEGHQYVPADLCPFAGEK